MRPETPKPPGRTTSDNGYDAANDSSGVGHVQRPRQASGLRVFAADDAPIGASLPDVIDPTDWLIFAFRLESSPIMLAPAAAEDVRRIAQWIARDPGQLELFQHAVRVVLDLDLADFMGEDEVGE